MTDAHPCDNGCQFAKDVSMPEHSCSGECQYDKHHAPTPPSEKERERLGDDWRVATHAENLEVIRARLFEHLSPAEKRELDEAIASLRQADAPVGSQAAIDAGHLWHALKDLSFDCDGVTCTVAPQLGTYNATFALCQRLASKYQASPHYQERTPTLAATPRPAGSAE